MARVLTRLCCAAVLAAVVCSGQHDETVENKLDFVTDRLAELAKDDKRGSFAELDYNMQQQKKYKSKWNYRIGETVFNPQPIEFKRAKGKKSTYLKAGTTAKVLQIPGDTEGSVAEVEVEETGLILDAMDEQFKPVKLQEHEDRLEKLKTDVRTDWGAMAKALVLKHAPKKAKKADKMVKAWRQKERALYVKLRKDFGLSEDEDDYAEDRIFKEENEGEL